MDFDEEFEQDEELDMYEVHQEQVEWEAKRLSQSGNNWVPIKPPERVCVIDESSSPKRITRPTMEELKSMRASGLWVFKAEGFEGGEWTVHVALRRLRDDRAVR